MSLTDNLQELTINSDVIYNIMLQSNLAVIIILVQVNKTFYNVYNDNYFWQNKFIKEYPFIPNGQNINWKTESIKMYKSIINVNNLMEFLLLLNTNMPPIYLSNQNNVIDIKTIYWLPIKLKENIRNLNIISLNTYFDYIKDKHNCYKYTIYISYHIQAYPTSSKASVNKDELINFLTLSLYHYPNLYLSDGIGRPFLYKDLIHYKNDDDLKFKLQCWEQVYKK